MGEGEESIVAPPLSRYFLISSMKPKCDLCGTRHESYQAHVFASNNASNRGTSASNTGRAGRDAVIGGEGDGGIAGNRHVQRKPGTSTDGEGLSERAGSGHGEDLRKQRWSRDSYNAYQREYMRKRRGK
jgi:hypothetical protein